MRTPETRPGSPHHLGATCDAQGVTFALFSSKATGVDLCLFDADGVTETRVPVRSRSGDVWHVHVAGVAAGQRYGWRVHGPYAPSRGERFNASKLLVDPYARAIEGRLDPLGPVYGFARDQGRDDSIRCDRDDAASKPKCVVSDDRFDWGDDRPPAVPWTETVLYEVHVKGLTRRHPGVPEALRGTFLGLASDAAIAHLKALGVTAVELMPVHAHADEPAVSARGLTNYWGYNTLAFFAPDERFAAPYSAGGEGPVRDFKRMVRRLHAAGFEVILDVVYNHTCEGDRLGPTVSFRGIDDDAYYRRKPGTAGEYANPTGCGNAVDASHPQVLRLIADSLRYWVTEMHVDGFRFDLATSLARGSDGEFDARSAFFAVLHQDPVLARVKLMAEPWDMGDGGYRLGGFPAPWGEWNGRFRDTVRRFWRGERSVVPDLGYRLTGSSDLFQGRGRSPQASVNFVAAHDGFTLRDLTTYERKHNEVNGENDLDGLDDNASQNCGVEGETRDASVTARRLRIAKSLLATVFVSRGVPLLQMGDDLWRTQRGNNNAYCQDSELTWLDWPAADASPEARSMRALAARLVRLRLEHPVLKGSAFLRGTAADGAAHRDITWLRPDGAEMSGADWTTPSHARVAFHLGGSEPGAGVVVIMNGEPDGADFALPSRSTEVWRVAVDTGRDDAGTGATLRAPGAVRVEGGALVVLVEVSRESL